MRHEARGVIVGGGVLGERRWAKVLGEAAYDPASEKPRM